MRHATPHVPSPPRDSSRDDDVERGGPPDRPRQFETLVEGFGRLVAQAVRRVAGRAAGNDLDDIQQDVMLALWKRLSREQSIEHPASYLYTAAVREAVRAVDRLRRRAEDPLGPATFELRVEPDAERAVEEREQQAVLAAALDALAPDRARAVRGHLAGLTVDEVMQLYGWSYQRTRNLVARGMTDLKAALNARGVP
jgi:RNA polymerase sigma factor (sigma-70 family)